jgi:hypothetical protein
MLFDLQSGKRKTVVRIVYGTLAALFLIGFVGFSIGSNVSGGIFDALGLTNSSGGGSGDATTQYDSQIEQAEKQVKKNPQDEQALLNVARYRFLAGTQVADRDATTGQLVANDDARSQWNPALDAWEKYLKTDPKKPDLQVAGQMVYAYQQLGDAEGAAQTQKLIVAAQPSAIGYAQLAVFEFADGNLSAGDAAADKAKSEAKGKQAKQISKQLDQLAKQARAVKKQAAASSQASGGQSQLQNPFGGLGASPGITTPAP